MARSSEAAISRSRLRACSPGPSARSRPRYTWQQRIHRHPPVGRELPDLRLAARDLRSQLLQIGARGRFHLQELPDESMVKIDAPEGLESFLVQDVSVDLFAVAGLDPLAGAAPAVIRRLHLAPYIPSEQSSSGTRTCSEPRPEGEASRTSLFLQMYWRSDDPGRPATLLQGRRACDSPGRRASAHMGPCGGHASRQSYGRRSSRHASRPTFSLGDPGSMLQPLAAKKS